MSQLPSGLPVGLPVGLPAGMTVPSPMGLSLHPRRRRGWALGLLAPAALAAHLVLLGSAWERDPPAAAAPSALMFRIVSSGEPSGAPLPGLQEPAGEPAAGAPAEAAWRDASMPVTPTVTPMPESVSMSVPITVPVPARPGSSLFSNAAPRAQLAAPAAPLQVARAPVRPAAFAALMPAVEHMPESGHVPLPREAAEASDTEFAMAQMSLKLPSRTGADRAESSADDRLAWADVASSPASAAAARDVAAGVVVPVYATRMPPPVTLQYELRSGLLGGIGELQWRPTRDGYSMQLTGRAAGLSVMTQVSQGGFDAAGLAPVRFTDQRLRGAAQAANFRRDAGIISFSGPSVQHPLAPGTQDRLSWMAQLAAVLEAQPAKAPLQRVVLRVVDARGDLSVWSFVNVGADTVLTGMGSKTTQKYLREATDPHEARVEVWVDPALHHLPARAVLRNAKGQGFELLLQASSLP